MVIELKWILIRYCDCHQIILVQLNPIAISCDVPVISDFDTTIGMYSRWFKNIFNTYEPQSVNLGIYLMLISMVTKCTFNIDHLNDCSSYNKVVSFNQRGENVCCRKIIIAERLSANYQEARI